METSGKIMQILIKKSKYLSFSIFTQSISSLSSNISSNRQKWSWSHLRALPRKSWRHVGASQVLGSGFLGFDTPASVAGAWEGGKGQEWAVRDLVGRRTGGRAHTPRSSSALLDIWKKKNSVT